MASQKLNNLIHSSLCVFVNIYYTYPFLTLFLQVFVRKKDRITIQEKQRQVLKERELELEAKKLQEERRAQARRVS